MKSSPFKVGIFFLSIWPFVFIIGHSDTFGVNWSYFSDNLPAYCYPDQQNVVNASKDIVRVRVESAYEGNSTVGIRARLGHRWYSKSESIPTILLVAVAVWGTAIIFVLGLILYRIVIEPMVEKASKDRTKSNKENKSKALRSRSTTI